MHKIDDLHETFVQFIRLSNSNKCMNTQKILKTKTNFIAHIRKYKTNFIAASRKYALDLLKLVLFYLTINVRRKIHRY